MIIRQWMDKFAGNNLFRKMTGNASWLVFEKALRLVVNLGVTVWVARYLGPKGFGSLNYVWAYVFLFAPMIQLGLNGIVVRELVRTPEARDPLLGTAFGLKFAGALTAWALAVASMYAIQGNAGTGLTVFVIITATGYVFQAFDVIDYYFQSKIMSKYVVISKSVALGVVSALKIVFIIAKMPLVYFIAANALELIVIAAGLAVAYAWHGISMRGWRFEWGRAKRMLAESWPLLLSSIAIILNMRLDQIMIQNMLGEYQVGIYSAAVRISEIWYFVPVAVVNTAFPVIVEIQRESAERYLRRLQQLFTLLVVISYAVAVPMTFASGYLINLLYGAAYRDAGTVLAVHIWIGLFVALAAARGSWIINEGVMKLALVANGVGTLANIALNVYGIRKFGVIGAAWATLVSQMIAVWLVTALYAKSRKIFIMQMKALILRWA